MTLGTTELLFFKISKHELVVNSYTQLVRTVTLFSFNIKRSRDFIVISPNMPSSSVYDYCFVSYCTQTMSLVTVSS
jgi:hypothetical protein